MNLSYSSIFSIILVSTPILILIILRFGNKRVRRKLKSNDGILVKNRNKLKQESNFILVQLENGKFISNKYHYDEGLDYSNEKYAFLMPYEKRAKTIKYEVHIIEFSVKYKGKSLLFQSDSISLDKTHIELKFAIQKATKIYIDKKDTLNYYVDLDFLNN